MKRDRNKFVQLNITASHTIEEDKSRGVGNTKNWSEENTRAALGH